LRIQSASGTLLGEGPVRAVVRAFFLVLATVGVAPAVQPLARIAPNVLFLPASGLALNARNGHVLWRTPRFDGQVATNGQGLLLISWVREVDKADHRRITRVCRLDARTGRRLWCRDWTGVRRWALDTAGRIWYMHTAGRLQVVGVGHGNIDCTFKLPLYADLQLMPLPLGGVSMLERRPRQAAELWTYSPGAPALNLESLPSSVYPFRGDGRGLLFYVRRAGEFYLAAPLRLIAAARAARHAAAASALRQPGLPALPGADAFAGLAGLTAPVAPPAPVSHFPRASLDRHAFLFTDWRGRQPIVRGGTYAGALWQAPRHGLHPQLALTRSTAILLEAGRHKNSRLTGFDLATGAPRFTHPLRGGSQAMSSDAQGVVLQSHAAIRLVDGATGHVLWSVPNHEGPLAAMARSSIVFWESGNRLTALARDNGSVLWRIRFQQRWSHRW
jgi:hypothetical protein